MFRNKITLLAICIALLIVTVCGNERASNAVNGIANISANPLSSLPTTPLPQSSPKTVRVRLTGVESNADVIDNPLPGLKIIIKAGAVSLNKETNEYGVVVFDAVPCGQEIVITAKGEYGAEDGVFHRRLICTGKQVDLGVIEFRGKYKLQQRRVQTMGFNPVKNVWMTADGKIIPMRTFRRIMAQRK
jgi:hypothetical protein